MLGRVVTFSVCLSATTHAATLPVVWDNSISLSTGGSLSPGSVQLIKDVHNTVTVEHGLTYPALEVRKVTSRPFGKVPLATTPRLLPTLPPAGSTFPKSTSLAFAGATSIRPAVVPTTTNGVPLPSALTSGAGSGAPAFPSLTPLTPASPNHSSGSVLSAGAGAGTTNDSSSPSPVRTLIVIVVVLAVLLAIAVGVAIFLAIKLKKRKRAVVRVDHVSKEGGMEQPSEKGLYQSDSSYESHDEDRIPLVAPGAYPSNDQRT
ncbi:hypothetical protein C8Q80DRAFT_1267164 [Daedaleopsis nitida]|nr:hypothetical protein C8Q80DRAFT_1267164 [Daedaleopsis nitida]